MESSLDKSRRWGWKQSLSVLATVAVLIRLWAIWYGLPFTYYADEYHEVMRALELGSGKFDFGRTSKGGFYLLLFIEYGVYFVALKLAGVVSSAADFAKEFVRDPSAFYLMGRATAALVGGATVLAVFWLGRLAYSTSAGVLAALFLAVNVLHIDLSRVIGVDVPMTLCAVLALCYAVRVAADGRRRDYLFAAMWAALATTTKLTGILLLVPLLIAHTYAIAASSNGWRHWLRSRDLWLAAAMFAVVLIGTNPGIVEETGIFSLYAGGSKEVVDADAIEAVRDLESVARPNLFTYYAQALLDSMAWPLFGLSLVAAAYAVWKRRAADVILLSFAIVNYVVIASTAAETLYYPRYVLPIIVVFAVLAGRLLADESVRFARKQNLAVALLAAALVALPVTEAIGRAYDLTQDDSRTNAFNWFDAHVPVGSRVLIEGGKITPVRATVPLRDTPEVLKRRIEYWQRVEPDQARLLQIRLAVQDGRGYDLELVRLGAIETLDDYAAKGIEYFVVRPDFFERSRLAGAGSRQLLSDLRSDCRVRLVKRIEGDERAQLGPTIEIYQLSGVAGGSAADQRSNPDCRQ